MAAISVASSAMSQRNAAASFFWFVKLVIFVPLDLLCF